LRTARSRPPKAPASRGGCVPGCARFGASREWRVALRGWARTPQGWKNVLRPSRPRFAGHLRMRNFS
jgi:hypothetical protein